MPTIYGNFPILLPGKTETVYPSGLKKISGTVVSLESTLTAANDLMQSFGSVWPKPETRKTENGWLEIPFSAYLQEISAGELNTGSSILGVNLIVLSKSFSQESTTTPPITFNWSITEVWLVDVVTLFTTLWSNSKAYPALTTAQGASMSATLRSRRLTGSSPPGGQFSLQIAWSNEIASISRTNFGTIDEVEVSYQRTATVL